MVSGSRFRVLIFDLDDTLLDTWAQLVQPAAREACQAMVAAGLATDVTTCLGKRAALFREAPRADLYASLVAFFGVDTARADGLDEAAHRRRVRDAGYDAYFKRDVRGPLRPFDGVYELLEALQAEHRLHLVTSGSPPTQQRKIELLALAGYFHGIHLVDSPAGQKKESALTAIRATYAHVEAHHFLCVGDRVDREIRAANQLGMVSCRIRYGEFAHLDARDAFEEPHYELSEVIALREVLIQRS
ncbi:HAD family hydrolase [Acanthopleuribacter pedis]|uniref:HAD hydrolase-like protein n=1 Tax=Acanthopleuribacter pedis TaxID=442870 RepID=A0A8J7QF05_9BACT|nr:HAD hydrolase-like protein [Acanthopleuribacter pedis]MBO1323079.1 HAD hydrolase-like protein [Acanthopleuribacter pedis]